MAKRTVWTKQHEGVLQTLSEHGRYIALKEYILQGKESISSFYFDAYGWYTKKAAAIVPKPEDVHYPIWTSLEPNSVLGLDEGTVSLEIEIDEDLVAEMDYAKWGFVVNYYYIPKDEADNKRHNDLLERYGIDDPTAYMSGFYPHIKQEIVKSWDAVFDKTRFNSIEKVGTIWEIRSEWVRNVRHYEP